LRRLGLKWPDDIYFRCARLSPCKLDPHKQNDQPKRAVDRVLQLEEGGSQPKQCEGTEGRKRIHFRFCVRLRRVVTRRGGGGRAVGPWATGWRARRSSLRMRRFGGLFL